MFDSEEIAEKKRRVRALLSERGLDAVYLKRTANFSWLTGGGYSIVGFAGELGVAGLLITKSREYVVCNEIEAPRMEAEEGLVAQGYDIKSFPWYEDQEAAAVKSLGGDAIGADNGLPGAVDVSGLVARLRFGLTPAEVRRFREQARLTAVAAEETARETRPGDTEYSVVGRLARRLWDEGMDYVVIFCAADDRISTFRHPVATSRRIEKRAMVSVNSRRRGLIVSLTRFVQFGSVPVSLRRTYGDNIYVDCKMMAATRPGRPVKEVFDACLAAYAEKGVPEEYKKHHQGGAIGYVARDYRVTFGTEETVQENQGFAWNPSITGAKSEDTMLATSAGPELLSGPVTYPVLEMKVDGHAFRRADILEL